MPDQLKIDNQIKLMNILENFVIKNIKYPLGDQTDQIQYYKSLGVDLGPNRLEYSDKVSELDKQNIYAYHSVGLYKETEQQKNYRNSAVQKIRLSNDPSDTIEIPLIDRLPRYYDDILTDIKNFNSYIKSQETINLKQVEKLRKKAFHTYAFHNDCQSLEVVPTEINKIFEKIHNGHKQRPTMDIIEQSFLAYAKKVLLDEKEVNKICFINKDIIIQQLETESIPFVREASIQQHKVDIKLLLLQLIRMNHTKESLLIPADPDGLSEAIYIFNEHEYFKKKRRKYKKLISSYRGKIKEIKGIRETDSQHLLRKKYTGDSETWLKQHKVCGQSLYQMIKDIVKKNKECPK